MAKRNSNFLRLSGNYLFPEINARKRRFLMQHPQAQLISLGIGDTTQPIPYSIASSLERAASGLGTLEGYTGYSPEQGICALREKIADTIYGSNIHAEEVFISDGAKCDLGRLQALFGNDVSIALQNPAYPVYIDGSIIHGVKKIVYMECTPENHFFPDLNKTEKTDLIYFCSPNNPTGAAATRQQLQELVTFAQANRSIIIFDAAYSMYIQDLSLPKSIYEINGAKKVAIEISSFSKMAGFTGVRLGWTTVPEELVYEDGSPVKADWYRLMSTIFNGASHIAQQGGLAVLEEKGLQEAQQLTQYYLENAALLKKAFENLGSEVYGGCNAPYLWVRFKDRLSWDVFHHFLENYHLITTPGSGFGSAGEGFIRLTAFGHRSHIQQALERLKS